MHGHPTEALTLALALVLKPLVVLDDTSAMMLLGYHSMDVVSSTGEGFR